MPVNAEKEIAKLWKTMHSAQNEICKTYYRWREVALAVAGPDADPTEIGLKAAEMMGADIGKNLLPRLNWLKGEEAFMMNLGRQLAGLWATEGAQVKVEQGESPLEILITCSRDPWPTAAKAYGVPMEEVALTRERFFQTLLKDVSVFFNTEVRIDMLKAIPRGEGEWVFKLYKA